MPVTHIVVPSASESRLFSVRKDNREQLAQVLKRQDGRAYVHYVRLDKRMDEWVTEEDLKPFGDGHTNGNHEADTHRRKRRRVSRSGSVSSADGHDGEVPVLPEVVMSEEEYDFQHHKRITQQKNFEHVYFRHWRIRTWYFSPYPLFDVDTTEIPMPTTTVQAPHHAPLRQHGRSSDLFAGTLGNYFSTADTECIYVCDLCFKYFAELPHLELHKRKCALFHPPGRKVYQRGAHTIWEIDGAKEKVYCQNLALFGKLFIDIKTVFFDLDNFFFYVTTDGETTRDNPVGYFSKEKISYDDYNLACITVFPPYQRKAFGILMIEFSYEISRRAGKIESPERPLSDLGLRSYLAYWVAAVVRLFRQLLTVIPQRRITYGMSFEIGTPELGVRSPSYRIKKTKGWAGEVSSPVPPQDSLVDPIFESCRTLETSSNDDGSASTHAFVRYGPVDRRMHFPANADVEQEYVVFTRAMVEGIVRDRDVKMEPCMKREHVML
ncbi:acyl-CoA N-acyltransferase [Schizophyllum amplum]|uniref:histone acetyltransferase n=1 Tax=Schizophyllum amplum TaxID=97359 RepID=A0A550CC89_9AGAR|nr:acyl-CoA N-acyltransferase [Auriculariopsis ampla]